MKLLGRNKGDGDDLEPESEAAEAAPETSGSPKQTAPKGRPTPKRDGNTRRGPVAPAPMTTAEARARADAFLAVHPSSAHRRRLAVIVPGLSAEAGSP